MSVNVTIIKKDSFIAHFRGYMYLSKMGYRDPAEKKLCLWIFFQSSTKDYLGQVLQMAV